MNNGPMLFFGMLAALASSFAGFVIIPQFQLGRQQAVLLEETGAYYPLGRSGEARHGADVYRSLGCVECHTLQVRGLGRDLPRGWGRRISVAQDYLHDRPVLLGNLRLGPDLANVGARQPDLNVHLQRLWNPRLVAPNSTMPRYPFLFERRAFKPGQAASPVALTVNGLAPGVELVPTADALALAAYLVSLRSDVELFEAPFPAGTRKPTAPADTNAPLVAATNMTNVATTNASTTNAVATTNPPANTPPSAK